MTQPVCRLYQAGHCRYGRRCKFSHSAPAKVAQSPAPSTSTPPTPRRQPPRQSTIHEACNPLPPGGVCHLYWTKGRCKREFDCKYKHIHPDGGSDPEAKPRLESPNSNVAGTIAIAAFLTEQGLAKSSLSPPDAHNRFKRFLVDTFRFKTSFEVYAFLLSLSSANNNNASWTQEARQLLLATVTSPDGSLRVAEIINWSQISICAGLSKDTVSFQRGILPLLRYMSSEFVVKSIMRTQTNHLFSIVLRNFEKFANTIDECMNAVISAQSFKDTRSSSSYTPIDIQAFASIAGVLHEFLIRFENAATTYPRLGPLVDNLSRWFKAWQVAIEATPPLFDNPFSNTTPAVREHVIDDLRERIRRLVNIVQRNELEIDGSDSQQGRGAQADDADHFDQLPCLHQVGHCHCGRKSKHSHSASTEVPQSPTPFTPTPPSRQPQRQSTIPEAPNPLPPGVCLLYWAKGGCKLDCKYKHIRNPETGPQGPNFNVAGKLATTPFLTELGLANISGIATVAFFEDDTSTLLPPTEAHNRFKRFLSDTFQFKNSFDVYAFLVPLSSAHSNNALWTQEERQRFLATVTSLNGSLRVIEVINWPQISICAGLSKNTVSFQRGILPILRYLSSEFVVKSIMSTQTNHLFSIVLQNFEKLADAIEEYMNAAIGAQSFKDPRSSSSYTPIDIQIFASIAGVLHGFLVRFQNTAATYPRLGQLVDSLSRWFQAWQVAIGANPPLFDNPFSNTTPAVREHIIDSIRERIRCLVDLVQRVESEMDGSDSPQEREEAADGADPPTPALYSTYDGLGDLCSNGPLGHDYDFELISSMHIGNS